MNDLPSRLLNVDQWSSTASRYFVCLEWDLEGIVAKRKDGVYHADRRRPVGEEPDVQPERRSRSIYSRI